MATNNDNNMEHIKDLAWEADATLATIDLMSKKLIRDHDYFMSTVDLIEDLQSPIRQGQRLTLEDLNTWVIRCQQLPPEEAGRDSTHQTRIVQP